VGVRKEKLQKYSYQIRPFLSCSIEDFDNCGMDVHDILCCCLMLADGDTLQFY